MTAATSHLPAFSMHQKVTPVTNKYRMLSESGELVAFAQQKKMKLKEEVGFFADEKRSQPLFSFKSRQVLDLRATTDVLDASGETIGVFKKKAGASLLRSTWTLEYGGVRAVGHEASMFKALLRRFVDLPFRFDFTFEDQETGQDVMHVVRDRSLRDRYTVTVPDERLPFAVAAAMTVALDAFQGR